MKQNADGTPSRSLRNVDALPLIGGMIAYLRDPLGFLIRTRKRDGDVATFRLLDRKFLFVSDPALIEQVLVKQSARFSKDWFARDLKRVLGEGLLTSEGDFWKRQRRLMSPAFHRERLAEYAAVMVERTERALAEWSVGEERDIHHDFMELTLDIVARTLFSADVEGVGAVIGPALDAVLDWYSNPILVSNPWLMSTPLPAARRHREAIAAMASVKRWTETAPKSATMPWVPTTGRPLKVSCTRAGSRSSTGCAASSASTSRRRDSRLIRVAHAVSGISGSSRFRKPRSPSRWARSVRFMGSPWQGR